MRLLHIGSSYLKILVCSLDKLFTAVKISCEISTKINLKDYLLLYLLSSPKEFFFHMKALYFLVNEKLGQRCFIMEFENKSQCTALKEAIF